MSEVNGRWGRAHQFARGKSGSVVVSCTSAGDCSAGWGRFVAAERHGRWGKTVALPGLSALGTKPSITGLSCTAAVNCAVGGAYRTHRGAREVFVASKRNGRWGKAIEIPGFTALNKEGFGALSSLSCISAGNCVAGGTYTVPADFAGGSFAPFVASERNGHWGEAIEVPGIPPAGSSECEPDSSGCVAGHVLSASCAPGGACVAGGWYDTPAISGQAAFVVTYKNGRWTNFTQIPGLEAPATGRGSAVSSVSCTPAGKCVAGGDYSDSALLASPAFVADEINGTWGQEHTVLIGS